MATAQLKATARGESGTGVARKLRAGGQVPGIIYGHGRSPQALSINQREIERLLSQIASGSTVIELDVDGKTSRTLIREIQRHPVRRQLIHVDFQELVAGEKVTVHVPLRFTGIPDGVRNAGGILEETMHRVLIRVDPSLIPDRIEVDVTSLTIGHSLHVRDIKLPEGVTALDDKNATICVVTAPKAEVEATPAVAEGEAAAAPAEPELIRKPKAEEGEEEEKK
jgi:large subunit ribosomal protein L25